MKVTVTGPFVDPAARGEARETVIVRQPHSVVNHRFRDHGEAWAFAEATRDMLREKGLLA